MAANYKRRLARSNVIRIRWFDRKFGKCFVGQLVKKWKIHVEKKRVMLGRLFERIRNISGRLTFGDLTREMKQIATMERAKRNNLQKHLKDPYIHNVEYFFRTWRFQSQYSGKKHKNVLFKEAHELQRVSWKKGLLVSKHYVLRWQSTSSSGRYSRHSTHLPNSRQQFGQTQAPSPTSCIHLPTVIF